MPLTLRQCILTLSTCLPLALLCSSCASAKSDQTTQKTAYPNTTQTASIPQCGRYPFLQKYGCSMALIQDSAIQGDPDAQYALGYMYYNGIGTTQDQANARLWIDRAAKARQPLAMQAEHMLQQNKRSAPAQASSKPTQLAQRQTKQTTPQPTRAHQAQAYTVRAQNGYTIQLMASHNKARVLQAQKRFSQLATRIHTQRLRGQKWFVLTTGEYAQHAQAEAAKKTLPASAQAQHPWVRMAFKPTT